ncbi:unnamed protein product [Linum tenue]|uniref:Uncharacterized protein n=1 Tax=Linum tenue TaxID=586396 RepID=A0AAV0QLI1_9ROSI|nr:unnamed protein product [Linum tenue]
MANSVAGEDRFRGEDSSVPDEDDVGLESDGKKSYAKATTRIVDWGKFGKIERLGSNIGGEEEGSIRLGMGEFF